MRRVGKAAKDDTIEMMSTAEAREQAVDELIRDMGAASSASSMHARWATWQDFHTAMLGDEAPALPLTTDKVIKVAAAFKAGGYRSFRNYLSKAKEAHILQGHPWTEQLAVVARKVTRSAERGLGPARQSSPFDVPGAIAVATGGGLVLGEGAPVGWPNLLAVATFFLLREIELAAMLVEHVRLDSSKCTVHVRLPVSKTDTTGIGCVRSWACLCRDRGRRPDCPYHCAQAQLQLLRDRFGDPLPAELPFFPNKEGRTIAKTQVVAALEATVKKMGLETVNESGVRCFGGHSFRVAGARRLGSLGVEVAKIMVLARWSSSAVYRYVDDTPLDTLAADVTALELQAKIGDLKAELKEEKHTEARTRAEVQREVALAVDALRAEFSPTPAGHIIAKCSGRKKKVHSAQTDGMDANPSTWRTRCGARFAEWRFTRHAGTEGFKSEMLCRTCFAAPQPGAQAAGSSSSSSSSSGGTSNNDGVMNAVDSDC